MSYDPDCQTDARVVINDDFDRTRTRLPAGDVDIHLRKEGPLSITRYAEAEFASPFEGEDFIQHFSGADPENQDEVDIVRINVRDTATGEYYTQFRGVITGLGNTVDGNEKMWKLRAQGPGMLTDKLPAGTNFREAKFEDVLDFCSRVIAENTPFTIQRPDIEDGDQRLSQDLDEDPVATFLSGASDVPAFGKIGDIASERWENEASTKTFKTNQHTVADVYNWVISKTGSRIWMQPRRRSFLPVGTPNPTYRKHQAHYLGGNLRLIDNNALLELNPINTMVINGKAAKSLATIGGFELNVGRDEYFEVKARHEPLYERAGQHEFHAEPYTSSSAESAGEVRNEAKSALKQRLDETTGGDMTAQLFAPIRPYDRVEAKLLCDENTPESQATQPPFDYEVSRVHHKIRAKGQSETKLNVGIHAALDDITVDGSWRSVTS